MLILAAAPRALTRWRSPCSVVQKTLAQAEPMCDVPMSMKADVALVSGSSIHSETSLSSHLKRGGGQPARLAVAAQRLFEVVEPAH